MPQNDIFCFLGMGNEFIFVFCFFLFLFWDLQLDKDASGYFIEIEILCALSRRPTSATIPHSPCMCACAQGHGKLPALFLFQEMPRTIIKHKNAAH